MIDAGIPLIYVIGSACILIAAYVKYRFQKTSFYEPLISGQINSSYGTIGSEDDDDSESTPITDDHRKNNFFDWSRLFFGVVMCVLVCLVAIIRWCEFDENKRETCRIVSPIIETLVWVSN